MNQSARKPGDPGDKLAETLSLDDPSIPVLTERLTLPPLDLNLDFRLPARPAEAEDNTLAGSPEEPVDFEVVFPPANDPPPNEPAAPLADERSALLAGAAEREPTDVSPRVPTSLLVSNLDALLATPPAAAAPREPDEWDLTQSDGIRPNRLEADLREMILLEIARRLPTEVEAIVRRHLDGAIEETIRRFTAEVRIALAGSLREMVDRAVKAELDRLKVPRN